MFEPLPLELRKHVFNYLSASSLFDMSCVNRNFFEIARLEWYRKYIGDPSELKAGKKLLPLYLWLNDSFLPQIHTAIKTNKVNEWIRFKKSSDCSTLPEAQLLPLYAAIYLKADVIVEKLLAAGARVNIFKSVFVSAKKRGKEYFDQTSPFLDEIDRTYRKIEFNINNEKNHSYQLVDRYDIEDSWFSPLHLAIATGNTKIVQILLNQEEAESIIQADSTRGLTPLAMAIKNGQMELVHLLEQKGAQSSPSIKTQDGDTLIHLAAISGNTKILQFLLSQPSMSDAITRANTYGITPLHYAVIIENVENVSLLLKHGANENFNDSCYPIYTKDVYGHATSPYSIAYYQQRYGIKAGQTPFMLTHNDEIRKLLLSHGADDGTINFYTKSKTSASHNKLNGKNSSMSSDNLLETKTAEDKLSIIPPLAKPFLDALTRTICLLFPQEIAAVVTSLQLRHGILSMTMNTSEGVNALYHLCQAYHLTPSIKDFEVSLDNEMQIKYFIEKVAKLNFAKVVEETPEFYKETIEEKKKCTVM